MKILRLSLENFQGVRQAEFVLNGQNADIFGDNATGKTTVFNAFTWLIFGNSSTGITGFTPKTKSQDGDEHNLEHSVECELEINGEIIVFRRTFKEVWKKTRGNPDANMSGHTTDYEINGVPMKEKEYDRYWEDVFKNKELPKLLSMPFYFSETLHWDKRRAILLEICGIIPDDEIMESDDELKKLATIMGTRSVDEYKKIIKASLTDINKRMQSIPTRIDEANKAIPEASGYATIEDIDIDFAVISKKISKLENNRAALLSNDTTVTAIRTKISELELELSEARRNYSAKQEEASAGLYETVSNRRRQLSEADKELIIKSLALDFAKSNVSSIEKKRNDIITEHDRKVEEHNKIQAEVFDETATTCNACGQDLPQDRANELREAFNVRKSNRLMELSSQSYALVERGKKEASKEMLAEAQEAITHAEVDLSSVQASVDSLKALLVEAETNARQSVLPAFETTEEYTSINNKISAAKSEGENTAPDTSDIDAKLLDCQATVKMLNSAKSALELTALQIARISELEKQEQDLGKQYEEAKFALYLCEKFSRVKAALLTDKINDRFRSVSFQLFSKNITNDGIEDVCEVLIPTVDSRRIPFAIANNAARINAGLEIIGVLGEHYDIQLPVFVDNAESVTRINSINSQLIRLVVSENDKKLRLELRGGQ